MRAEFYIIRDNKTNGYVTDIHSTYIESNGEVFRAIRIPQLEIARSIVCLLKSHYDVSVVRVEIDFEDVE